MFYFATESGDHVIKILICGWSVINVDVVFVCWGCKFCLYFRLLKLSNLYSLFNMSWMDSEIESLITFLFVHVGFWRQKFCNWCEKPAPKTDASFLVLVSGADFWSVCHWH